MGLWEIILSEAENLAQQLVAAYGPGAAAAILHIAYQSANAAILMKMVEGKLGERAIEIPIIGGRNGEEDD